MKGEGGRSWRVQETWLENIEPTGEGRRVGGMWGGANPRAAPGSKSPPPPPSGSPIVRSVYQLTRRPRLVRPVYQQYRTPAGTCHRPDGLRRSHRLRSALWIGSAALRIGCPADRLPCGSAALRIGSRMRSPGRNKGKNMVLTQFDELTSPNEKRALYSQGRFSYSTSIHFHF